MAVRRTPPSKTHSRVGALRILADIRQRIRSGPFLSRAAHAALLSDALSGAEGDARKILHHAITDLERSTRHRNLVRENAHAQLKPGAERFSAWWRTNALSFERDIVNGKIKAQFDFLEQASAHGRTNADRLKLSSEWERLADRVGGHYVKTPPHVRDHVEHALRNAIVFAERAGNFRRADLLFAKAIAWEVPVHSPLSAWMKKNGHAFDSLYRKKTFESFFNAADWLMRVPQPLLRDDHAMLSEKWAMLARIATQKANGKKALEAERAFAADCWQQAHRHAAFARLPQSLAMIEKQAGELGRELRRIRYWSLSEK